MKKAISNIFDSDAYIIFVFLLSLFAWGVGLNYHIYLPIVTIIIVASCMFTTSSKGLIPIFLSLIIANIFNFPIGNYDVNPILQQLDKPFLLVIILINAFALIYFYIKNRRTSNKFSLVGISLVGLFIAFMVSDIYHKSLNFLIIGLLVLLFYFIRHTIDYYQYKQTFLPYFSKTMLFFGLEIALQTFIFYMLNFTLESDIGFAPKYGWGISNNASLLLLLTIPVACYSLFSTHNFGYFITILLIMTANILTTSRGGILAMAVMVPFLLIINYRKYHSKRDVFIGFGLTLAYFSFLLICFYPYVMKVIQMLFHDGLNDSGRFDLYRKAIEAFKNNILVGGGSIIFPVNGNLWQGWYHSTVFDILGQLGLVGAIFFIIHFVIKYYSTLNDRSSFKWFVLVGFICSSLYGLIDVIYFNFSYLLIYIIILATVEYSSGYISHLRND